VPTGNRTGIANPTGKGRTGSHLNAISAGRKRAGIIDAARERGKYFDQDTVIASRDHAGIADPAGKVEDLVQEQAGVCSRNRAAIADPAAEGRVVGAAEEDTVAARRDRACIDRAGIRKSAGEGRAGDVDGGSACGVCDLAGAVERDATVDDASAGDLPRYRPVGECDAGGTDRPLIDDIAGKACIGDANAGDSAAARIADATVDLGTGGESSRRAAAKQQRDERTRRQQAKLTGLFCHVPPRSPAMLRSAKHRGDDTRIVLAPSDLWIFP
jgi:hypothetical protein